MSSGAIELPGGDGQLGEDGHLEAGLGLEIGDEVLESLSEVAVIFARQDDGIGAESVFESVESAEELAGEGLGAFAGGAVALAGVDLFLGAWWLVGFQWWFRDLSAGVRPRRGADGIVFVHRYKDSQVVKP